MTSRALLLSAGTCGALFVALGAFGAHGLEGKLSDSAMATWDTAVRYHMAHSLLLLGLAVLAERFPTQRFFRMAGMLVLAGIIVFSGSLYILALSGIGWLGAVTPIGGVLFIAGWVLIAMGGWRLRG